MDSRCGKSATDGSRGGCKGFAVLAETGALEAVGKGRGP